MKKKSLVVAVTSSCIICGVLVLTLVGYIFYMELKERENQSRYELLLRKSNAKFYAGRLDIARLKTLIESEGALKGHPVIEGIIRNNGTKEISDILIKARILDQDKSVLYEVTFRPQEPALGSSDLTQIAIPYLSTPPKAVLRPSGSLTFKKVLVNCPEEILSELNKGRSTGKEQAGWPGTTEAEVLSVAF